MSTLIAKIDGTPLGPTIWKFDSLPSNLMAEGVQTGDLVVLSTGELFTLQNNHSTLSLAASQPGVDYYVDPVSGVNTNSGLTPSLARLTIQNVHDNLVTTGNGDRINLVNFSGASDFTENVTITKRNVSIRAAVPVGNSRWATVVPASGVALTLSDGAWGFTSYGVRYVGAGASGYAAQITADGAGFVKCDFSTDTADAIYLPGHATDPNNAGSGLSLIGCMIRESGARGIRQGVTGKNFYATNVNVIGCQFYGNTNEDIIDVQSNPDANNLATLWYQWLIHGNWFMDRNKATYLAMNFGKASQTLVSDNRFNDSGLNNVKIKILASGIGFSMNADSTGHVTQASIT